MPEFRGTNTTVQDSDKQAFSADALAAPEPGYWHWVPQAFAALRHRNYRLYWLGQIVSLVGTWMQRTAQGWLVTDLVLEVAAKAQVASVTNWYVALVSAMGTLPVLLIGPFSGVLADYFDKRRVLIITQSLMAMQAFALAIFAYTGHISIGWLMALALMLGVVWAFDIPARQGMAIELVGRKDLANAIALNSGVFNTARIVGPSVTGIILALHFSVADAFLVNAVSFLAVIGALLLMRGDFSARAGRDGRSEPYLQRLSAGISFLLRTRGVRRIVVMVGVLGLLAAPYMPLLPAIARYRLGAGPAQFGFLATCVGIGAVTAAVTLASISARGLQHLTLRIGYALFIGSIIALTLTTSLTAAYFILAVCGFGMNWTFANSNTIVQLTVPDELRGRVMGTYSVVFIGMFPLGTLMMGWASKNYGVDKALLTGAIIAAIVAIALFVRYPHGNTTKQSRP